MSESTRSRNTPSPYPPQRPTMSMTRGARAWAIVWKVVSIALLLLIPLLSVVWHQASARTEQIDTRVTRVEERTVRALESIDSRLTFIEQRSWTPPTPTACSP